MVIAPHADDETLGCGGTVFRHVEAKDSVSWVIITEIPPGQSVGQAFAEKRDEEVNEVSQLVGYTDTYRLGFPPATLDNLPLGDLIASLSKIITTIEPNIIYVPFPGDVHSDHGVVFQAVAASSKWFRYPSIESIRAYETLSETNFNIDPTKASFNPNFYIDINKFLDKKLDILNIFESEMGPHPFPRSNDSIKALATLRGSEAGVQYAEAFMLLKQVEKDD